MQVTDLESISRSALVPYSVQEMYALVRDVDTYPRFLPWCSEAQTMQGEGGEVEARIAFHISGMSKSFTTRNRLVDNEEIHMQLVDGPFSALEGSWRFEPLGESGCKISLDLEYDFSSHLVSVVTGPVFNRIANSLVDAFRQRAIDVYGER